MLPIKNVLLGIIFISTFSAVSSCKPNSNLRDDAIVEVEIPVGTLELLTPTGCIGSSWLHRSRVTTGMLMSSARPHLKAPAYSSEISSELMVAVADNYSDNYSKVQKLIAANVDINEASESGCTALIWALVFKRRDMLSLLLDAGADIEQADTKGTTPLMFAALAKDTDILRKLLAAGADVNAALTGGTNEIGTTALHYAVTRKDNLAAIKLLIKHGANVTAANETGRTPLIKAAWWGGVDYIQLLLDAGADLERTSNIGKTALHESISSSTNAPMIRTLISKGANVNTTDKWGKTPLMDAVNQGQLEVVKLLVEADADIEMKSNEGQTALDIARTKKPSKVRPYTEVASYLESLK